jgi:hypothetical protein
VRNFTRRYKDGTAEEVVTTEVELRDKNGSLELIGKHLNLWNGEIMDPDEILERILGIPKALIPASFERDPNADSVDGHVAHHRRNQPPSPQMRPRRIQTLRSFLPLPEQGTDSQSFETVASPGHDLAAGKRF